MRRPIPNDVKSIVGMTNNLKEKEIENEQGLFQMIRENIYDVNGNVAVVNKFYIPVEKAVIKVFSSHFSL